MHENACKYICIYGWIDNWLYILTCMCAHVCTPSNHAHVHAFGLYILCMLRMCQHNHIVVMYRYNLVCIYLCMNTPVCMCVCMCTGDDSGDGAVVSQSQKRRRTPVACGSVYVCDTGIQTYNPTNTHQNICMHAAICQQQHTLPNV